MRRTTLILAVTLICACGAANSANGQPAPATASPVAFTCTASGAASPLWPAAASATALAGASGVKIVLRGFRGDVSNYTGPARLTSSGPILLEAAPIGDFEGVVGFGAGVSRPSCANVTASSSTLSFHFIASGS